MTITIRTSTINQQVAFVGDELDVLGAKLTGQLITATDAGYDAARKVAMITSDRYPLAIVQVANTQDVAETVRFASERGLPLAVRSGGHSIARYSMINDAIIVDLSQMKAVSVDPATRTARVQAGATSGDLAGPAHAYGLALTTGDTQSVGMGGLTTGGGLGFMARKYGLAIDNLLAAQVVTAAGEILTASEDQNADLFWAIRGGGGNFGIVTEFTFQLAQVGQILGGALVLPATYAVIRGYLELMKTAPDDLTTIANVMYAPPAPFLPADAVGTLVFLILVCWTGDTAEGERALAPLRALATPIADTVSPMPYPEIYKYTAHQASPHGVSIRSMFAHDLSDSTLDAIMDAMAHTSSPYSLVQLRGLGGAYGRVANDATAFAHHDKQNFVTIIGLWLNPAEDASPHVAWTNALWQAIRGEADGVYVNFLEKEGASRVRDAYPPETYARLVEIKRKYDPRNIFHFNQNIPPQG